MKFVPCAIPELLLIEYDVFARGARIFYRELHQKVFHELGLTVPFIQDNISSSAQGKLRGLH